MIKVNISEDSDGTTQKMHILCTFGMITVHYSGPGWPISDLIFKLLFPQLWEYNITTCICQTMVCSYPHGLVCLAMWCVGYVLYRAVFVSALR